MWSTEPQQTAPEFRAATLVLAPLRTALPSAPFPPSCPVAFFAVLFASTPSSPASSGHPAAELEASLFGEGTELLKAEYASQRTSMASILQRIDSDDLQKDIDDVAGEPATPGDAKGTGEATPG